MRGIVKTLFTIITIVCGTYAVLAQEPPGPPAAVWNSYHDYQRLSDELAQLSKSFPNLIKVESIGQSEMGRQIWLATIPNPDFTPKAFVERPQLLLDGAMHGSEVIGSESMLYYIQFLITRYDSDPTAREIVDGWLTYVVPMVNPDGVERGKTSDDYRSARKNANLVDLNRNFDWNWTPNCGPGCSSPCRSTCWEYPGTSAWSEPESRLIRDEIISRGVSLYLSGHAGLDFEQLIRPGVFDDPQERARHLAIQACIESITPFRGTGGNQSGAAKNWAYGVPLSELRAAGTPTLAFNLEIYSIPQIEPGSGNHYWWCRYNPPAAADDEVAQWCTSGTGIAPTDTMINRMEMVKTTLAYITRSMTEVRECSGQSRLGINPIEE